MSAIATLLVCLSLAEVDPANQPLAVERGWQYTYQGSVTPVRPTATDNGKDFDFTILIVEANASGMKLFWTVDERGAGGWPWPERFGELSLDANFKPIGSHTPSLLYDFGEGTHIVPLISPLFRAKTDLAEGETWEQDGYQFKVDGSRQADDTAAWSIVGRNATGTPRKFQLAKEQPLILGFEEPVVMNRGTDYELKMSLASDSRLTDEELAKVTAPLEQLVALRKSLERVANTKSPELSENDRKQIVLELPKLHEFAKQKSLNIAAPILASISRDLDKQATSAKALDGLIAKHVGKPASEILPGGVGSESLTPDSLRDKVTVLHFWDYRDKPLTAPYGQVGYLEFLQKRHKAAGVQVIGIAANEQLAKEESRPEGLASIKRLKDFMKLSYTVLPDDGTLLKNFGDPRAFGAGLPLVVVIDRQGTIAHVHTGLYAVDSKDGLKELDEIVAKLSQKSGP